MRASVASSAGDRLPLAATPQLFPLLLPDMLPYFFNVRAESRIDCFSPKIVSSSMAVAPVAVPPSETSFTNCRGFVAGDNFARHREEAEPLASSWSSVVAFRRLAGRERGTIRGGNLKERGVTLFASAVVTTSWLQGCTNPLDSVCTLSIQGEIFLLLTFQVVSQSFKELSTNPVSNPPPKAIPAPIFRSHALARSVSTRKTLKNRQIWLPKLRKLGKTFFATFPFLRL